MAHPDARWRRDQGSDTTPLARSNRPTVEPGTAHGQLPGLLFDGVGVTVSCPWRRTGAEATAHSTEKAEVTAIEIATTSQWRCNRKRVKHTLLSSE
jgi:hypothetical protein